MFFNKGKKVRNVNFETKASIKTGFKHNKFLKKRKSFNFSKFKTFITFKVTKQTLNNISIWFALVLLFLLILLFFWPTFKIKTRLILKNDDLINIERAYDSTSKFVWQNIFMIEKNDIINELQKDEQNIKKVDIDIILPDTIKIVLSSYKSVFNSTIWNKTYIITENWVAIPKNKTDSKLKNIVIKTKEPNFSNINYKKIISDEYMKNIQDIYTKIEENILWIKVEEIKYYITEREIIVKINNSTMLIFSINSDINKQVEKLVQFNIENKENINLKNDWIYYIDLRITDKIFYCEKQIDKVCKNNLTEIYWKDVVD